MKRPATVVLGVLALAALSACGGTATATSQDPPAHASAGVPRRCPHKSRYQPVNDAIFEAEHAGSSQGRQIHRAAIARQATIAWLPGFAYHGQNPVVYWCGTRIARRTVVVDLYFPHAPPSVSLSNSEVWVARFAPDRYRVWFVFH